MALYLYNDLRRNKGIELIRAFSLLGVKNCYEERSQFLSPNRLFFCPYKLYAILCLNKKFFTNEKSCDIYNYRERLLTLR